MRSRRAEHGSPPIRKAENVTTTQSTQAETVDVEEFRARAREWLEANAPRRGTREAEGAGPGSAEMGSEAERRNIARAKEFQSKLADAGFAGITYPKEYGGAGLTPKHQSAFNAEVAAGGYILPTFPLYIGHGMCLPTIFTHGTEEQKKRFMPPLIDGSEIWSQLFSEPGAGSDVAGLQMRAERHDGEWILNGQKVWTTGAHYSEWGEVIVRTDPDLPKHQGLTMFLVDLHAPGVTVRPLRQITGEAHFNEVFFDDVRVPDSQRLDEVGAGWKVALTTLMNERMAIGGAGGGARRGTGENALVRLARDFGLWDDAEQRDRVMDLYVRNRVFSMLRERMAIAARKGIPGPEFSMLKLIGARLAAAQSELSSNLAGASAIAWEETGTPGEQASMALLNSRSGKIAGGTDEVMLNILGERVLGLPQDPRVDKGVPFRELKVGTLKSS
jgi:alkylation response protein AidB-like acyl-CoA dehydrogenase